MPKSQAVRLFGISFSSVKRYTRLASQGESPLSTCTALSVGNDDYWVDSDKSLRERIVRMDEGNEGHAFGVEEPWIDGWDCTVVFDDEVVGGLHWETLDQLRDNLAASEGISEVLHEDREVFHLKVENLDFSSVEAKVAGAVEQTDIGDPADRHW
jgi:hypothetical protein